MSFLTSNYRNEREVEDGQIISSDHDVDVDGELLEPPMTDWDKNMNLELFQELLK